MVVIEWKNGRSVEVSSVEDLLDQMRSRSLDAVLGRVLAHCDHPDRSARAFIWRNPEEARSEDPALAVGVLWGPSPVLPAAVAAV